VTEFGTITDNLTDITYQGAAFIPNTMTRDTIQRLRSIAFRRFYSRPGFLLRRIVGIRNINDLKVAWKGLKSLLWIWVKNDLFKTRKGTLATP
jgi:hypothetical protein